MKKFMHGCLVLNMVGLSYNTVKLLAFSFSTCMILPFLNSIGSCKVMKAWVLICICKCGKNGVVFIFHEHEPFLVGL